jgi:hypothetical protein
LQGRALAFGGGTDVRRRALVMLSVLAVLLTFAAPVAAVGKPVERFNDHFSETFVDDPSTTDDDLCGVLPVMTTVEVVQNGMVRLDKAGESLFRVSGRQTITWTNPVTGLSVSDITSGQFRDIRVVENADGTTTFYSTNVGVPERLQTADGSVLIKDVGRIVFANTFNFNVPQGEDPFVSSTIVSIAGPHPEAESDFTLFCAAALDALT